MADLVLRPDGAKFVLRPACTAIGLAPNGQQERIKSDPRFTWEDILSRDSLGREQVMFCIPVEQVVPWLFTINSNKVKKGEVQENLLRFQTHLGKELNRVAVGLIGSEKTAVLEAAVESLTKQMSAVVEQVQYLLADNAELRKTNEFLWKARGFEASSASYGMLAAKARKQAVD
jgi:hypothetical protein